MELKYIEVFCAVVELKSFSKAAQALSLTQPTISIHIKALEEEFGARLLDRLGRAVMPTQDGEILYRYAKEIVHLKESAQQALAHVNERMSGRLRIGASTIPGEYLMPRLLAKFGAQYPEVFPTLRIGDSEDIHQKVIQGEVDLGIIGAVVKDKNIISREFLDDELVLVGPADYAFSALGREELKKAPLIVRETGSGSRSSLSEQLGKAGISLESLRVVAEIGSSQALIQCIKSGMGLAFISRLCVVEEIRRGELKAIKVKGISIARRFHIITHRLRADSRISRAFIEHLLGDRAEDPARRRPR